MAIEAVLLGFGFVAGAAVGGGAVYWWQKRSWIELAAKRVRETTDELRQRQQFETFEGRFRPTDERLREVSDKGVDLLMSATEEQLGSFDRSD